MMVFNSCFFHFFTLLVPENVVHSTEKIWIRILAVLRDHWLAAALTPGAILHQSPKTVCPHLCMNVRSFRARLLERFWGNPVSQFWHLISIKHKKCYIFADWLGWKCYQSDSGVRNIIALRVCGMFLSLAMVVWFFSEESQVRYMHFVIFIFFIIIIIIIFSVIFKLVKQCCSLLMCN